jgi:hypothetical protein
MTSTTLTIALCEGERHALLQLLDRFIHQRVWEAVRVARDSTALEKAGQQAIRLGQLRDLAGEEVLRGDLTAHATDLVLWLMEAQDTTAENEAMLAELEQDESGKRTAADLRASIENCRDMLVMDFAHRYVCEKIVARIRAAAVAATIRVPVRTWREKAIITAALGSGLPALEGIELKVGWVENLLIGEGEADSQIDVAHEAWRYVGEILDALRTLRTIQPGPDAYIDAPANFRESLTDQIDYMGDADSDTLGVDIGKRDWAEALAIAIDLRDEMAGGERAAAPAKGRVKA